jgi:hypothetical protein
VSDFEVRGAEQFYRLSKALKAAGRTDLRKELTSELRKAGRPLIARTRAAARSTLPKSGGLAEQVAREPQRIQVRTGERTAGVRVVVGRRRGGAQSANRGSVRHPVFARSDRTRDQWTWVTQRVTPGWFDRTLERDAPTIARPAIQSAMQKVIDKIIEGAR